MFAGFSISCVNKSVNGVIVRVGGENWSLDIREAVSRLVSQSIRLTLMLDNTYFEIGVRGEGSDAYLVLEPDAVPLDTITNIPSC